MKPERTWAGLLLAVLSGWTAFAIGTCIGFRSIADQLIGPTDAVDVAKFTINDPAWPEC